MATLTVEIPEQLLSRLEQTGQPVQTIILQAVEAYILEKYETLIAQTQTWQLCVHWKLPYLKPNIRLGQDDHGKPITNYAELS